jgi:hypothetical protein
VSTTIRRFGVAAECVYAQFEAAFFIRKVWGQPGDLSRRLARGLRKNDTAAPYRFELDNPRHPDGANGSGQVHGRFPLCL